MDKVKKFGWGALFFFFVCCAVESIIRMITVDTGSWILAILSIFIAIKVGFRFFN